MEGVARPGTRDPRGQRAWLLALLLPPLLWPLCVERNGPGAALPLDAPAREFSGHRARGELETLLAGVGPHPVGTRGAQTVRGRIAARLGELGLAPHIQDTWVPNSRGWIARVRNVWASLPATTLSTGLEPEAAAGTESSQARRDAILLLCHYDSVGAGPGAGDDASGVVCLLEIARALLAAPGVRERELIFLFDEGEEAGLFGARAFLDEHPAAERVGVVVNLEARGTDGASIMFETSRDNAGLIELYSKSVPRPFATSLTGEAYRRMPNSTDLRLFLDRGYPGYNFAFIGGGRRYHTDRDDPEHLSTATLQHQGESVLALVRALLAVPELAGITGAGEREQGPVVYTSILGCLLLAWPEALSPWLAVLALLPIILVLRRARGCGLFRWRELLLATPVGALILALPLVVGYGLYRALLLLTDLPIVASAHGLLGAGLPRLLFVATGLLPLLACGPFLARLARPLALWAVLALGTGLAALLSGIFLPAISFLPLLPAFTLAVSGLFMGARRGGPRTPGGRPAPTCSPGPAGIPSGMSVGASAGAADLPAGGGGALGAPVVIGASGVLPVVAVLCVLWIPASLSLEEALGFVGGFVWSIPVALLSLAVAPLMVGAARLPLAATRLCTALLAVLAFLAFLRLPHFSPDIPAPLNLACYHDTQEARWLLHDYGLEPGQDLARAAGGDGQGELWLPGDGHAWQPRSRAPWSPGAPTLELQSEELLDDAGGGQRRRLHLLLTPGSGGDVSELRLVLEGDTPLLAISVAGHPLRLNSESRRRRNGSLHVYGILGSGAEPVEVELLLQGSGETSISILELTLGLPPCGADLLRARAPERAPLQGGDRSIVAAHVTI